MPVLTSDPLLNLMKKQLEPFIRHIRFPKYKNVEPDTRIDFSYPITALVGANGTNKSSILRAIQGAPGYSNLGNYWFSTDIDPIEESPDGRNCFIYGYFNKTEDKIVEVLKTRIRKEDDPDYWEPSRPVTKYGMEPFAPTKKGSSRVKTRWDNVNKEVIYLDFRQNLSAFDRYFYQGNTGSLRDRKNHIRRVAPHLRDAIEHQYSSYSYHRVDRVINKENRFLKDHEIKYISEILGKAYSKIALIRHCFLKNDGYTAVLTTSKLTYTEALGVIPLRQV